MIYNFDRLQFCPVHVDRFIHKNGAFDVAERPYAAISFRTCGTGDFQFGTKSFRSSKGDLLFIPADTPYRVEYSGSESIVIHLEDCNYDKPENLRLPNAAAMETLFLQLLSAWSEHHSVNRAKSMIYDIFEKISEGKQDDIRDTALAACIDYIGEHCYDPDLDVERICEHTFLSASGLQRKFREHFALSPKQYLTKLRMNHAMNLLMENKLSVRAVAYACGFSDEKYFSRAFKKTYGYPPSHLQKQLLL